MKPTLLVALLLPAAVSLAAQTSQQAATTPPPAPTNRWSADPAHSAVNFRVRHLGITWVNGSFGQWTADLNYDPAKAEAVSVTARLQTASITTGNDLRTAFSATTSLKRQDYGITLNRFMEGAQIVGDEVRITIAIEATERTTTP